MDTEVGGGLLFFLVQRYVEAVVISSRGVSGFSWHCGVRMFGCPDGRHFFQRCCWRSGRTGSSSVSRWVFLVASCRSRTSSLSRMSFHFASRSAAFVDSASFATRRKLELVRHLEVTSRNLERQCCDGKGHRKVCHEPRARQLFLKCRHRISSFSGPQRISFIMDRNKICPEYF